MSLILEALKKSEAERRLGQAPELLSPAPYARRRTRRSGALMGFGLGVLAMLALGAGGWWWLHQNPRPDAEIRPAAVPAAQITPVAEPTPGSETLTPATTETGAAPARPTPPLPATAQTAGRTTPAAPQTAAPARPEATRVPANSATPPPDVDIGAASRPSRPAAPSQPAPPQPAPPLPIQTTAPTTAAATPGPATAPAGTTNPALPSLPSLASLPTEQRQSLPPLRLSMHVYDARPEARFVLIDGKRLRRGDDIASGLVLDDIRPDGVVIRYGGQRFLLQRP